MTRKTRRNLLIAIGLGMLLLSQMACESSAGPGMICQAPQAKVCNVDQSGVQACWCQ